MAKTIGGHIVGMSTALEAIAARQAAWRSSACPSSRISPPASQKTPLSHAEVHPGRPGRRAGDRRAARQDRGAAVTDDLPQPLDAAMRPARAWMAQDPDPATRAELQALVDARERTTPRPSPSSTTASTPGSSSAPPGLRGELGAGPTRMNRVLVAQAAAGLAAYLLTRASRHPDASSSATTAAHNSEVFARDTAELMPGAGVRAILLPALLPTPVLAFAVRHLGASAGVMVTAATTRRPTTATRSTWAARRRLADRAARGRRHRRPRSLRVARGVDRRPAARRRLRDRRRGRRRRATSPRPPALAPAPAAQPLRYVYTPMHGVGLGDRPRASSPPPGFADAARRAGAGAPRPRLPDGRVPEPRGAGRDRPRVRARARDRRRARHRERPGRRPPRRRGADGDRRAGAGSAATRSAGCSAGAPRAAAALPTASGTLACSLVSSPGLAASPTRFGLDCVETLTGFKWISRAPGLVFGYEEALGYLVDPDKVRDKDGISAAVAVLALVRRAEGRGHDARRAARPSSPSSSADSRPPRSRSASPISPTSPR